MYPGPQRLEDVTNIRDAMRRISQEASVVVELINAKIGGERLDGRKEEKTCAIFWNSYGSSAKSEQGIRRLSGTALRFVKWGQLRVTISMSFRKKLANTQKALDK
jgi:hypothetical protein